MVRLSQLVEERRELTIPVGGGTIHLGYTPSGVTPRMMAMADEAQRGTVSVEQLCTVIAPMLLDWDVTDDEGAPLPLTAGGLQDVPLAILVRVMTAIGEDIAVPKAPSATSSSGSSPEDSQAARPSGISSFAPVATSA
jgi:hypothetical protein